MTVGRSATERVATRFATLVWLVGALSVRAAFAQAVSSPGDDFLRLVDAGNYAESWGIASDFFKRSVSLNDWVSQVEQVRRPMGDVVTRALKASEPQKNPPGAPPGDYLLQTYETKFAQSEPARIETLVLIQTDDGRWRAIGYFVR